MRQIIEYSKVIYNTNFVLWFLMTNFPEGIDESTDCSIAELIEENCELDKTWIDNLTGYYDGVLDESDGYINEPKTIMLSLATNDCFFVEFHPGDTLYFLNDQMLGCTGPEYSIKKITFECYQEYIKNMVGLERLLLLPMLKVHQKDKDTLFNIVSSILHDIDLQGCSIDDLCECIFENCLEE